MITAVFIRVIFDRPEAKNLYILPIFPFLYLGINDSGELRQIDDISCGTKYWGDSKTSRPFFRSVENNSNNLIIINN